MNLLNFRQKDNYLLLNLDGASINLLTNFFVVIRGKIPGVATISNVESLFVLDRPIKKYTGEPRPKQPNYQTLTDFAEYLNVSIENFDGFLYILYAFTYFSKNLINNHEFGESEQNRSES